jgi:hypothetical protein
MTTRRITIWSAIALAGGACGVQPAADIAPAAQAASTDTVATHSADEDRDRDDHRRARVQHVLLLSVDGLHQGDLAGWVAANPRSALAQLSRRGVTYTAARGSTPSDSFPGLLALVTGGTPRSTGVYYDDSYDRTLFPPGSGCAGAPGTEIVYDESIDHDLTQLFSGGIDPRNLPLARTRGGCAPVFPHAFLAVNTIFEVVRAAGGHTAWSDKHPAYDLVNGPSGEGVEDLYTPEINSSIRNAGTVNGVDLGATLARCDGTNSLAVAKVNVFTDCIPAVEAYDDVKVRAILHQIAGDRSDGSPGRGVPTVFGMNFQAVSVGQKLPVGGYADAAGMPSANLADAIAHTDASIGELVAALDRAHLLHDTMIIVTAKHGQSPIDRATLAMKGGGNAPNQTVKDPLDFIQLADPEVDNAPFTNPLPGSAGGTFQTRGHLQTDDAGVLWLADPSAAHVAAVAAQLTANAKAIFADVPVAGSPFARNITSGPALAERFGDPARPGSLAAARAPDVVIQPDEGVIYSSSSAKIAEHGGAAPGDIDVALLVVAPAVEHRIVRTPVTTTQVAPTILEALGIPPDRLRAVREEHTEPLPQLDD